MTVQLLRAHGCRVLGLDFDPAKLELARRFGAEVVNLAAGEDPVAAAQRFSRGRGVDAVIITASTKSNEPVHQAALMCRKRGRIVLVGVTGLELSRADFFEKELTFQVSCSYGPGRYDPNYEDKGNDYPVGFVRWTEQRNFEAVLDMMAERPLDVKPLISHRFSIERGEQGAYDLVGGAAPSLGILLEYPTRQQQSDEALRVQRVTLANSSGSAGAHSTGAGTHGTNGAPTIAFLGAGNYSTAVLIPAFKSSGAVLRTAASSGGVSGLHAGRKFGFQETTTDPDGVLADPGIDAVVITTRHDSHAAMVCQALRAGKHVFVEKPIARTLTEMDQIEGALAEARAAGKHTVLMVGFNRRFARQVQKVKTLLASAPGPKAFVVTVNAGPIRPSTGLKTATLVAAVSLARRATSLTYYAFWQTRLSRRMK